MKHLVTIMSLCFLAVVSDYSNINHILRSSAYQSFSQSLYFDGDNVYVNENYFVEVFINLFILNINEFKYIEVTKINFGFFYYGIKTEKDRGNQVYLEIEIKKLWFSEALYLKVGIKDEN